MFFLSLAQQIDEKGHPDKKKKKEKKKEKEKEKKDEKGHHIWSRIHKYGVEVLNIHILRIKEDNTNRSKIKIILRKAKIHYC